MKRLLLLLAAGFLSGAPVFAASADAIETPDRISYQGKIAIAGGALIGAGSPENRDLTFRIWTSPTSTTAVDRLWSEKITTTVSEGEFSVMLGSGDAVNGEARLRNSFAEVFTGQNSVNTDITSKERYLGITIGTGTDEIFPRQKIVTTAFAFRAKVAESVAATAVTTGMIANGAVTNTQLATNAVQTTQIMDANVTNAKLATDAVQTTQIKDANVTNAKLAGQDATTPGNAQVVLGAVSTEKLQNNAVTTAKLADNAVTTAKIANGAVTLAKLGSDIQGFWSTNGATPADAYRATGKVGILTANPFSTLTVGNGIIDSASSRSTLTLSGPSSTPETTSKPGFYHRSQVGLGIFTDAHMSFQVGGSALTEAMYITNVGNVGIGTNAPQAKLDVQGSAKVNGKITSPMFRVTEVLPYLFGTIGSRAAATYAANGGTWLVTATCTGYVNNGNVVATLKVDGVAVGDATTLWSGSNGHITLTRQYIVTGKAAGNYQVSLTHTGFSDNDYSQVTILELPF